MINETNIKNIQGLRYYNGSHSKIRALNKKSSRPSEFGHKIWATTLVFIDFLEKNDFQFKNKSVLEIGCGWGILGLFLAKNYACKLISSDLDEKVLPIVDAHADLNSLKVKTLAQSFSNLSDECLKSNDIIVGVEVCYSEEVAKEICELINRAFKFNVQQIFIADPGRPDFLDIICNNNSPYKKEIYHLPGTKNGKVTTVLHMSR